MVIKVIFSALECKNMSSKRQFTPFLFKIGETKEKVQQFVMLLLNDKIEEKTL